MSGKQPLLLPRDRRVPELDGFRGIAVLLVVAGHYCQYNVASAQWIRIGINFGSLGVLLFFVLSGFLITSLLLQEKNNTGRIDFRKFYERRALRLGPGLLLFLLTVVVLIYLGFVIDVPRYEIFAALFYGRNLVGHSETLSHLWSLSLEEQFYLCWPLLLSLVPRRRLLAVATSIVGVFCVWRGAAIALKLFSYERGIYYERPYFRFDSILIGACLAIVLSSQSDFSGWIKSLAVRIPTVAGWAVLLVWTHYGEVWSKPLYLTIQSILVTFVLGQVILTTGGASQAWLRNGVMRYAGQISYSLYLWQQPFLVTKLPPWGILRKLPWNLIAPFAIAVLSFHLMERPILKLKSRLK